MPLAKIDICTNENFYLLFHDGGLHHIETSTLVNQWTDSYIIGTSVMKELKKLAMPTHHSHLSFYCNSQEKQFLKEILGSKVTAS